MTGKTQRVGENAIQKLQRLQKQFHADLRPTTDEYIDLVFESDGDVKVLLAKSGSESVVLFVGDTEQVVNYLEADWKTRLLMSLGKEISE